MTLARTKGQKPLALLLATLLMNGCQNTIQPPQEARKALDEAITPAADIPLAAHVFCGSEFCYSEEMLGTLSTPIMQFVQGDIDELYVATNRFVNTLKYEPVIARFLPLVGKLQGVPLELQPEPRPTGPRGEVDFVYEPSPEAVVDAVLQRYMETVLFQAVAENAACEQAARLTAMRAATDNADHLLEELTLHYHKARQEAITRELIEIVSGAAATDER